MRSDGQDPAGGGAKNEASDQGVQMGFYDVVSLRSLSRMTNLYLMLSFSVLDTHTP